MRQKNTIWARIVDSGEQKPIVETKIEFYEDPASTPIGGGIASGCYVAGYDEDKKLKGVRGIALDTDEERELLESRNLNALTDIYHHSLQFKWLN